MRTFLAIIGALAIFVVGVFAVLIFIGLNAVKPLMAEATAYADDAIPGIATAWDGEELYRRASAELREELPDDKLRGLMSFGAKNLGDMIEYGGAACEIVDFQVTTGDGRLVQAACEARATHELGGAGYALTLLKRNDTWSILGFIVIPDQIVETDRARTVRHNGDGLSIFTISIPGRAVGLSSRRAVTIGADIQGFEKIENIQQPE